MKEIFLNIKIYLCIFCMKFMSKKNFVDILLLKILRSVDKRIKSTLLVMDEEYMLIFFAKGDYRRIYIKDLDNFNILKTVVYELRRQGYLAEGVSIIE